MHKLGYSMLLSSGAIVFDHWFRRYHKNVHLVIWERPNEQCVYDPQCIYADAAASVPAPNSTHLNLPIWRVFIWRSSERRLNFIDSPGRFSTQAGGTDPLSLSVVHSHSLPNPTAFGLQCSPGVGKTTTLGIPWSRPVLALHSYRSPSGLDKHTSWQNTFAFSWTSDTH